MSRVYPHNLKSCKSVLVFFVMWFLSPGAVTQAQPKPDPKGGPDKAPVIKPLLQERHKLLSEALVLLMNQYEKGTIEFTRLFQAERDLLRATLTRRRP